MIRFILATIAVLVATTIGCRPPANAPSSDVSHEVASGPIEDASRSEPSTDMLEDAASPPALEPAPKCPDPVAPPPPSAPDALSPGVSLHPGPCLVRVTYADARGRIIKNVGWDKAGRKVRSELREDAGYDSIAWYKYDSAGRVASKLTLEKAKAEALAGSDPGPDAWSKGWQYAYDKNGRLVKEGPTSFTYNGRGQLTSALAPYKKTSYTYRGKNLSVARTDGDVGATTTYSYRKGLLVESTTKEDDHIHPHITRYTHDQYGRITRIFTSHDAESTELRLYDAHGNVVESRWWEVSPDGVTFELPDIHKVYDYSCWEGFQAKDSGQ